ncbi:hypothetical protein N6147_001714 [Proteus mirabilis]|nr:hypothetical protein [Proteus mirabilis]ELR5252269.1 hypothetical protein [Providencia rettgeri]
MNQIVTDELHLMFNDMGIKDSLRKILRAIDGIPNVQYLVKDGKVFVFEKLVSLMLSEKSTEPQKALELLAQAYVTPMQAVTDWKIVPYPFEVIGNGNYWVLHHTKFDAVIPKKFDTVGQVQEAMAELLLGRSITPDACELMEPNLFYFEKQVYKSIVSLADIPSDPLAEWDDMTADSVEMLSVEQYIPGHPLLTEIVFTGISEVSGKWQGKLEWMHCAAEHDDEAISSISFLPLERLNADYATTWVPEEDDKQVIAALREYYPELSGINDAALYFLYDEFQMACNQVSGAEPIRDIDFLFYATGAALGVDDDGPAVRDAGKIAVYLLSEGESVETLSQKMTAFVSRDKSLRQLALWRWNVSKFLEIVAQTPKGAGQPIAVFSDLMNVARKYGSTSMTVTQSRSDLG